ncbi:MAG: hypothetical protein E7425_03270 [Ruminococcaceae bacterium]|nr:hypothetical protein [Oscillospiraceae bacterium]
MIAKGEVNTAVVRERCKKVAPDGKVEKLAELYASAYEKAGVSPEEAWDECICDSLGNMNMFSPAFESSFKFVEEARQQIKSATEELRKERGPPAGKTENAEKYKRQEKMGGDAHFFLPIFMPESLSECGPRLPPP